MVRGPWTERGVLYIYIPIFKSIAFKTGPLDLFDIERGIIECGERLCFIYVYSSIPYPYTKVLRLELGVGCSCWVTDRPDEQTNERATCRWLARKKDEGVTHKKRCSNTI